MNTTDSTDSIISPSESQYYPHPATGQLSRDIASQCLGLGDIAGVQLTSSTKVLAYPLGYSRLSAGSLVLIVQPYAAGGKIVPTHDNKNTFGIVVSWFDSDVYSSASASLMINGEVRKIDARSIFLIDND